MGCLDMLHICSTTSQNKVILKSPVVIRPSSTGNDFALPPSVEESYDHFKLGNSYH